MDHLGGKLFELAKELGEGTEDEFEGEGQVDAEGNVEYGEGHSYHMLTTIVEGDRESQSICINSLADSQYSYTTTAVSAVAPPAPLPPYSEGSTTGEGGSATGAEASSIASTNKAINNWYVHSLHPVEHVIPYSTFPSASTCHTQHIGRQYRLLIRRPI